MEPLPPGTQSAGGMPDRVKCLHALVAHELAVPGANPLGREAADAAGEWWAQGPCVPAARRRATLSATRVAAIDCGTNSLRLLVADVDPAAGRLDRRGPADGDRPARPGRGFDRPAGPEALERTLRALRGYAGLIGDRSAERGAHGGDQRYPGRRQRRRFRAGCQRVLGIEPEVLSGTDEAHLSFTGATAEFGVRAVRASRAVPGRGHRRGLDGVRGRRRAGQRRDRGACAGISAVSVDIGCVRLTERHLHSDPPPPDEISAAAADIDAALDVVAAAIPVAGARTLVGLAGSVTTVAGLALGLREYDSARIHHARIPVEQVSAQTRGLLGQTRRERAALGVMHPGRADVIAGGAMVLDRIMQRFGFAEVLASEHDILDGIAWALAAGVTR